MLIHDRLGEKFSSITPAFACENLIILAKLDLVVLNCFSQVLSHTVALQPYFKIEGLHP